MASDAELFDITVPDEERTLGGVKDDIEPDHPSVIVHMVKSLMPGQDLTRVTIPSFFLEPRSLLERMADLFMHPDLLLAAPPVEDPLERFLAVVRWYVSGWHYKTLGVKKPYNPIIGETFAAVWQHEDGSRSQYIAEQVEHRPPISAIYFENKERHVAITAHIWTRSQFSAPQTTKSILDGAGRLAFTNRPGEEYWITLPTYYAHNLLLGTLRMEVGDTVTILCQKTGYRADLEFTQMTMFSSEPLNGLKGKVCKVSGKDGKSAGEVVATITGKWDAQLTIERGGKKELFLDIAATPVAPKRVLPISAQGPWESRRLWEPATEELCKRPTVDWGVVDREKGQLEEEQRLLAVHAHKPGQAGYEDWPTKLFHKKSVTDPLTGKTSEHYEWDGWAASKQPGPSSLNVLALSRSQADARGGWKGAGAVEAVEKATRSIKLSTKRQADFARQDKEKASS